MKHQDRAVSETGVPCAGRRQLLKRGLATGLGAWAGSVLAEGSSKPVLSPSGMLMGARLLRRQDPQGVPMMGPDTFGPMMFFMFPVAVAATPFDLYVADAGLGGLYRYDAGLDAMAQIPGVGVVPQTRLAALTDGSVIVSDGRLPRRYGRNGRLMQTLDMSNIGGRIDDLAVDASSGKTYALDRVTRQVLEVNPLGHLASQLRGDLLPGLPGAMAADRQKLYVHGQDCRCLLALDPFAGSREILIENLGRVDALTASEGWLIVADAEERVLRVFKDGVLRGEPNYDSLKLLQPGSLSVSRQTLYVADLGSRRLLTFRLRP